MQLHNFHMVNFPEIWYKVLDMDFNFKKCSWVTKSIWLWLPEYHGSYSITRNGEMAIYKKKYMS